MSAGVEADAEVGELFVHPVKSCAGVALPRVTLDERGPLWDRLFQLVDASGSFVTQRELPALAEVRCALVGAAGEREGANPAALRLAAPDLDAIEVPLAAAGGPRREVVVWRDTVEAEDMGDEAAAWIEKHTGRALRLVRMADDARRAVDPRHARAGATTRFTDGYPLLVIARASLDDLNRRIAEREAGAAPLEMIRFRPNVVLEGCPAYADDEWRRVRIVGRDGTPRLELDLVKPCSRCVITTTDPRTLERGKEPLRSLATYRRTALDDGTSGVFFGTNAVHRAPGRIEVGDRVEVVERGPSRLG